MTYKLKVRFTWVRFKHVWVKLSNSKRKRYRIDRWTVGWHSYALWLYLVRNEVHMRINIEDEAAAACCASWQQLASFWESFPGEGQGCYLRYKHYRGIGYCFPSFISIEKVTQWLDDKGFGEDVQEHFKGTLRNVAISNYKRARDGQTALRRYYPRVKVYKAIIQEVSFNINQCKSVMQFEHVEKQWKNAVFQWRAFNWNFGSLHMICSTLWSIQCFLITLDFSYWRYWRNKPKKFTFNLGKTTWVG